MPNAAPKPCIAPGCRTLVNDGTSRCPSHKVRTGSFADSRRGSRHERGYGSAWDKLRERILARDNGLCQPCARLGQVTAASQVDHIRTKKRGGTDDDANLQAICVPCHKAKTAREHAGGGGWKCLQPHQPGPVSKPNLLVREFLGGVSLARYGGSIRNGSDD